MPAGYDYELDDVMAPSLRNSNPLALDDDEEEPWWASAPGGSPASPPSLPTSPAARTNPETEAALKRLEDLYGDRPVRKKSNIWQKIGAAAIGGTAGYVNAARRTRIPDSSVDDAVSVVSGEAANRERDRDWRERVADQQNKVRVLGDRDQARRQSENDAATQESKQAQARRWAAEADRPQPIPGSPGWYRDPKTGERFQIPRETRPEAQPNSVKEYQFYKNEETAAGRPVKSFNEWKADQVRPPAEARPVPIVAEYKYYVEEEKAAGRTPLSFDAYQTRDANRRAPRINVGSTAADDRQRRGALNASIGKEKTDLRIAQQQFDTAKLQLDARRDRDLKAAADKKIEAEIWSRYEEELTSIENSLLEKKNAAGQARQGTAGVFGETYEAPVYPHPRTQRGGGLAVPDPIVTPPPATGTPGKLRPPPQAAGGPTVGEVRYKNGVPYTFNGREWVAK